MREQQKDTSEEGSATVTVVGLCVLAVLLITFELLWIFSSLQLLQAQRSADLAAIAAADAHRGLTSYEPCAIAQELVLANGAIMDSCVLDQEQASVLVSVGNFQARARAGSPTLH